MNKKVSVLIPSYNHSRFVSTALDSILADDYPCKEIVIIDDGSTDNSVDVINKWIENNGKKIEITFVARENRGVNATLNELKKYATGKYITTMASDDYLLPNSINKRMEFLLAHPEKKLVFGDAHVVDEYGSILKNSSIEDFGHCQKQLLTTDEGILKVALFSPVFSGSLEIMDRDVFSIIGDYPEDLDIEDWFFWQRVAINHLAIFLDDYVSCYRRHKTNMTSSNGDFYKISTSILKTCIINYPLVKDHKLKFNFCLFIIKLFLINKLSKLKRILNPRHLIKYICSRGWMYKDFGYRSLINKPLLIINPKFIKIGNCVNIRDCARLEVVTKKNNINFSAEIVIGDNVLIEQGVHITSAGKVIIGKNTSITPYVTISNITHSYDNIDEPIKLQNFVVQDVVIGEDCFIGAGAVILPGVHLGRHCCVGANSVVTQSFSDYSIIAGNPAKLIKKYNFEKNEWIKVVE